MSLDGVRPAAGSKRVHNCLAGLVATGRVMDRLNRSVVRGVSGNAYTTIDPCIFNALDLGAVRGEVGRCCDAGKHGVVQVELSPLAGVAGCIADKEIGPACVRVLGRDENVFGKGVERLIGADLFKPSGDKFVAVAMVAEIRQHLPPGQAVKCLAGEITIECKQAAC